MGGTTSILWDCPPISAWFVSGHQEHPPGPGTITNTPARIPKAPSLGTGASVKSRTTTETEHRIGQGGVSLLCFRVTLNNVFPSKAHLQRIVLQKNIGSFKTYNGYLPKIVIKSHVYHFVKELISGLVSAATVAAL